jgi:hypothetical protein
MLDVLVLSRDRPAALERLLRSLQAHHPGGGLDIAVLYTATSPEADQGYFDVRARHTAVRYVCELAREAPFAELAGGLIGGRPVVVLEDDCTLEAALGEAHSCPAEALPATVLGTPGALVRAARAGAVPPPTVPGASHQMDHEAATARFLAGERLALAPDGGWEAKPPLRPAPGPGDPRVSVIMPLYNCEDYVGDAVRSVLAQTYRSLEFIVVDDGSTDGSAQVVREVMAAHPQADVQLLHQRNSGGCAYPRNMAIPRARGEYILCLDADDQLTPSFVTTCVGVLDGDPHCAIAYSDYDRFEADQGRVVLEEYNFFLLTHRNMLGTASMFRRSAWEEVGGYNAHVPYEDWDFWISCGERGHYARKAHGTLWRYRVRANGLYMRDVERDRLIKAHLVTRHPGIYTARQMAWARAVIAGEPTAPDAVGVIPPERELARLGVLAPPAAGAAPAPGLEGFVTVANASELVRHPELLAEYAATFAAQDRATLVLYAPADGPPGALERVVALVRTLGIEAGGPGMVALTAPRQEAEPVLLGRASAMLTEGEVPPTLATLPRFDTTSLARLRRLAEASWQRAAAA